MGLKFQFQDQQTVPGCIRLVKHGRCERGGSHGCLSVCHLQADWQPPSISGLDMAWLVFNNSHYNILSSALNFLGLWRPILSLISQEVASLAKEAKKKEVHACFKLILKAYDDGVIQQWEEFAFWSESKSRPLRLGSLTEHSSCVTEAVSLEMLDITHHK